jgi:hypothetical protein
MSERVLLRVIRFTYGRSILSAGDSCSYRNLRFPAPCRTFRFQPETMTDIYFQHAGEVAYRLGTSSQELQPKEVPEGPAKF